MGVDFDSDLGKLQRLMAESVAGTTRRNAILHEMRIQAGDTIIDVGCGAGHLLTYLAKAVGVSGTIYGFFGKHPHSIGYHQRYTSCHTVPNNSRRGG